MPRVTEHLMYTTLMRQVQVAQRRNFEASRIAQDGLRVRKPSDDPVAAARALALDSSIRRLDSMQGVADTVAFNHQVVESSLATATNILFRIKEITIAASSDTMSTGDRAMFGREMTALRDQLLDLANSKAAGRYVFGGFATATAPVQADGTFVGDARSNSVEVAPGVFVPDSVPGGSVFAPATGVNIIGLLDDLSTALGADDMTTLRARMDDVDTAAEQITNGRADAGMVLARLDAANDDRGLQRDTLAVAHAEAVEADTAQSLIHVVEAQNQLNSAFTQASSLIDMLSRLHL